MPLEQVKDAITGFVKGCKEFGITFASDFPTIYHAGNVQDVKQQLINACKKAGYSPQAPPELVVTFVSWSQAREMTTDFYSSCTCRAMPASSMTLSRGLAMSN